MKNLITKYGLMVLGVIGAVVGFAGVNSVSAAPDADLVASLASTTAIITDNKATILSFIVGALLAVFVIALSIKGLRWVFGMLLGLFGHKKGRR